VLDGYGSRRQATNIDVRHPLQNSGVQISERYQDRVPGIKLELLIEVSRALAATAHGLFAADASRFLNARLVSRDRQDRERIPGIQG
jgi:hypothetical protein